MPHSYDHVGLTTQQQVNLLCLLLVARAVVGAGHRLPFWVGKQPVGFTGSGECGPKQSGWTVKKLLNKVKLNFWPQDRTTKAAKQVLEAHPTYFFCNLYLMVTMSTEKFARALLETLVRFFFFRCVRLGDCLVFGVLPMGVFLLAEKWLRSGAANCEHLNTKSEKICSAYRGNFGEFFASSMTYQAVMRNQLRRLSREKGKQVIKNMLNFKPRKPWVKSKRAAWRSKMLRGVYQFLFNFPLLQPCCACASAHGS